MSSQFIFSKNKLNWFNLLSCNNYLTIHLGKNSILTNDLVYLDQKVKKTNKQTK